MRVAILTDIVGGDTSNGPTTMLQAVRRHAPPDLDPHVYTLSATDRGAPGYTRLVTRGLTIPLGRALRISAVPLAAMTACGSNDHVGLVHMMTAGPAGRLARRLAAGLGLPLIGSYDPETGASASPGAGSRQLRALRHAYARWLYGGCERILVPSEAARLALIQRGWQAERLAVCRRGVDSTTFSPARRSTDLRRRWQVSDERPAILCGVPLVRGTGTRLLAALGELLDSHRIPYRFVVAGDGPMADALRSRVPEAVFLGALDPATQQEVMASADLFVLPSDTDAAPDVVLEAQASGLPVLVTSGGGPREYMLDGNTGYVCTAGDERDFCWRVASLIVDVKRRKTLSHAARAYAEGSAWPLALQPLFGLYREALAASSAAATRSRVSRRAAAHV